MTINTGSFAKDLQPGVESWWGNNYNKHPMEWTQIFESRNSTKAFEEMVQMLGFGLAPIKTEGAAITAEDTTQGFIDRWVLTQIFFRPLLKQIRNTCTPYISTST